jgi:hypothetical protein
MAKKSRPTIGLNSIIKPKQTKYVDKDMYMSDNESKVTKDTLARHREQQEVWKGKIRAIRMMEESSIFGPCPDETLIPRLKKLSEMSYFDYIAYKQEEEKQHKENINRSLKERPIDDTLVKKLFGKLDQMGYDSLQYDSFTHFEINLDPIEIIGEEEYDSERYNHIIEALHNSYRKKFETDRVS